MEKGHEIQVTEFINSENEENNIERYVERQVNIHVSGDYVFEIDLSGCQKAIIIILNLLTGGMGTILVPFLNKKRQRISDNNFLKIFFNDSENNNIPDSEESKFEISSSLIDSVFVTLKLNLRESLTKKKRIKLLKKIFGFISGMSYSNSLFTALINLLSDNPKYPNYKFSLKILFYNIFNPGVGVILSCASLFPYCKCSEEEIDVRGIVLSILGILIGVLLMICPISIGIGLYLIQLTEKMITLFPLKITLIFFEGTGTIISFILSGINHKTILEAIKEKPKPLDLIFWM